jgi:hypothetical protein
MTRDKVIKRKRPRFNLESIVDGSMHEGNTEEEKTGNVVFT